MYYVPMYKKNVLFKISNGNYYSVSKGLPILLNFSFLKIEYFFINILCILIRRVKK